MRVRSFLLIFILTMPASDSASAVFTAPERIRVDILGLIAPRRVDIRPTTELRLSNGWSVPSGTLVTIDVERRKLRVRCPGRPTWRGLRVESNRDSGPVEIAVTGRNRRNRMLPAHFAIEIHRDRIAIRSEMDFESLVASAVFAELEGVEDGEALRAAAIAIRSFLVASVGRHANDGFDVCDSTHCVHSVGLLDPTNGSNDHALEAVRVTTGNVLVREGRVVSGFITACCGGRTVTPAALWGVADSGDHASVECRSCSNSPYFSWTRSLAASSIAVALSDASGETVRADYALRTDRDRAGWVRTVHVAAGARDRRLSGDEFRMTIGRRLGWDALPSPNFSVARERGDFVFRGAGFGHGIGLCLSGAIGRAREGAKAEAIVLAYFPRASIVSLPRRTAAV